MSKLYIICGHGAGDPGTVNGKYKEAELVRKLGNKINELADKEVILCDTSTNFYKSGKMNTYKFEKGAKVLELHMDSAGTKTAKGGHVIIYKGFAPDKYDTALANMISKEFPGRADKLKKASLYNMTVAAERGISYRLLECCFISNKDDLKKFNANIEHLAQEILKCFDIIPVKKMKTETDIAKEVIAGKFGNGHARRRKKIEALGYNYENVRAIVNKLYKG